MQLARPGWLPRQTSPSLHGGRRGIWSKCPWPRNDKSTIRKVNLLNITQIWIAVGKSSAYLQLRSFTFVCTAQSLFRTILDEGSSLQMRLAMKCQINNEKSQINNEKSGHDRNVLGNSAERFKSLAIWLPWANQQIKSNFTSILRWNKVALTFGAVNKQNYHGNHSNPHIGNAIAWLHAPTTLPFDVWRLRAEAFALSIEHASTIYKLPASGSQDLIDRPWVSRCTDQSL